MVGLDKEMNKSRHNLLVCSDFELRDAMAEERRLRAIRDRRRQMEFDEEWERNRRKRRRQQFWTKFKAVLTFWK